MKPTTLSALCSLLMISDPWKLEKWMRDELVALANAEAKAQGHDDWIAAYHAL